MPRTVPGKAATSKFRKTQGSTASWLDCRVEAGVRLVGLALHIGLSETGQRCLVGTLCIFDVTNERDFIALPLEFQHLVLRAKVRLASASRLLLAGGNGYAGGDTLHLPITEMARIRIRRPCADTSDG
jgi:hypothetical protein